MANEILAENIAFDENGLYIPQTWLDGVGEENFTPMTADRMNHIEQGIKGLSDAWDSQSQAQSIQLEVTGDVLIDSTHSWSTVRKGIEIPDGYRYGGLLGFAIPANTIMRQCYAWEYPDDHRCAVEMDFTSLGGAAVNATATVWVNLIPISRGYL